MQCKFQVAIVGIGPAGLAASQVLLRHGAHVLLIDENRRPGGQLLRRGGGDSSQQWPREVRTAGNLLQYAPSRSKVLTKARVLGREADGSLWVEDARGRMLAIQAEALLMASGARERFVPFPGWTLPGVISTGAAQVMLKESGVLPAQDLLLAGCTPLLYALGSEILASNGRVQAIVDQANMRTGLGLLIAAAGARSPLGAALASMSRLIRGRVPVHRQRTILDARGDRELEEVLTIKLDNQGEPIPGSERIHPARIAAVGHGFVPNVELPAQAGCDLIQDFYPGTWAVKVDGHMQTSVPGVYAAGEVAGIGGGGKALLEGQMAGWAVLQELGLCPKAEGSRILKSLSPKRRKWLAYGRAVHKYCRPPGQNSRDLSEETVICRCEKVTLAEIKRGVEQGFTTPGALKMATRCGMGMCQGRTCLPIVSEMLAERFPDVPVQPPSVRMPVKAVSVDNMARDNGPNEAAY
ncbi:MAG: FAD-dependent oxidoreductase [Desulfovermiculus sp.]|nr:FAD-dependent oxidoreductase [Desulfovermiculus sp.]